MCLVIANPADCLKAVTDRTEANGQKNATERIKLKMIQDELISVVIEGQVCGSKLDVCSELFKVNDGDGDLGVCFTILST